MEIKTFYKTQRELAIQFNRLIDSYWKNEITEPFLVSKIKVIYQSNPGKIIRYGEFTTILKQQCGKKRLEVVATILESAFELNLKKDEEVQYGNSRQCQQNGER